MRPGSHRSPARARRLARRLARQGFTLIEVMMALAIMTVGALGIMALQQAATRGNMEARQMTTAVQCNRTWLERVRVDALMWNARDVPGGYADTQYISVLEEEPATDWFAPISGDDSTDSYAFDYFGQDTDEESDTVYCTHLRFRWIRQGDTLRVDARTFWHRRGDGADDEQTDYSLFPDCGVGAEDEVTTELARTPMRFRAVYASDIVRWTNLQ